MSKKKSPASRASCFLAFALCLAACGSKTAATPPKGSQSVDATGGTITLADGASLVIPAGALSSDKAFSIDTAGGPPIRDSDFFVFGPDVTFATPVTITIPMYGAFPDAHIYWISPTNSLVDLGGIVSGSSITWQVSRLPGAAYACGPHNCGTLPSVTGTDASADATD